MRNFEPVSDNDKSVIFEVDPDNKMHEQVVAVNALGVLTAKRAKDADERFASVYLATKLVCTDTRKEKEEGEKSEPVETSATLSESEFRTLHLALSTFTQDAPNAIQAAIRMNGMHGANVAAVEIAMAASMTGQLEEEFSFTPVQEAGRVGFALQD